jgi:hypothetical protein
MGQSIIINFDSEDLGTARARSLTDLRKKNFAQFVAGDALSLDLFLTGTSGLLDIQSYSEVRVGIGDLDARPTSGTYSIDTSNTLNYNHTASELETIIDSAVAPAVVTELSNFVFKIQFESAGAQTIPAIDSRLLTPSSTVSVTKLITGDATTKETWLWRLYQNPAAFTKTFTNISGSGVRGTLSLATSGIYDLLGTNSSVKTFFEVELTDSSGTVQTVLQAKVNLNGEVIGHNFTGSIPVSPSIPPSASTFLESFPDPDIVGELSVGGLNLSTGANDGYVLTSDATGDASWQPSGGSVNWGSIGGTLSDQTDLDDELDKRSFLTVDSSVAGELAFVGGNQTGNARGKKAIDIQSARSDATQIASGLNSVCIGSEMKAGPHAAAIGRASEATGMHSIAAGHTNLASGNHATAVGYDNTASASNSSAVGRYNQATDQDANAIGSGNEASGDRSSAIGHNNEASGTLAVCLGNNNVASGDNAQAHGEGSSANGDNALAMGKSSVANGDNSLAVGFSTQTDGSFSTAIGHNNTASNQYSTCVGSENETTGDYSHASGRDNTASAEAASAVGFANEATANNSTAIGHKNDATGVISSAIGSANEASGDNSSAFGRVNTASAVGASAFGFNNTASGDNSSAIGFNNSAVARESHAFGRYTNVGVADVTEIGNNNSLTQREGAIRISGSGNGQVALTVRNHANAPGDGGATSGSELFNRLPRDMWSIQRDGLTFKLYFNDNGTVKSLTLGTVS